MAVVPSQPAKNADVFGDHLVEADTKAILVAIGPGLDDIGVDGHQLHRFVVIAHVGMIQERQPTNSSGACRSYHSDSPFRQPAPEL